ncbi:43306_t:CDS:2 [Gigaspora margarita]|uniref:43306_t:CDS:1 n=1 Tax=Gigaspora margarita TaxID=4874 RepID=A0ABM8VY90_GIGMA|nr:43306_t:CDS:2 [Gigaspora margarita]
MTVLLTPEKTPNPLNGVAQNTDHAQNYERLRLDKKYKGNKMHD